HHPATHVFPHTTLFRSSSTRGTAFPRSRAGAGVWSGFDSGLTRRDCEKEFRLPGSTLHHLSRCPPERDTSPLVSPDANRPTLKGDRKSTRLNSSHQIIS